MEIDLSTYFQNKPNTNAHRLTSVCNIVIDRHLDEEKLSFAARYIPRSKFVVLAKRTKALTWKRPYLTPPIMFVHESNPGTVHVQVNCHEKLVNIWRKNTGYMYPIENAFNHCPDVKTQIIGQDFLAYGFGYIPYFKSNPDQTYDGVDVRILRVLAEKFQFNVEVRRSIGWDVKVNGNWTTGTIGRVYYGDAQFGIGSMAFTSPRYEAVDFTHYDYFGGMFFFMRKPGPLKSFLKAMEPIDEYGWIGFLTAALVLGSVLFLTLDCHPLFKKTSRNTNWVKTHLANFQLETILLFARPSDQLLGLY